MIGIIQNPASPHNDTTDQSPTPDDNTELLVRGNSADPPPSIASAGGNENGAGPPPVVEKTDPVTGRPAPMLREATSVKPTDTDTRGPLIIEPEPTPPINVGGGGKLFVPREDIADGIEMGEELDVQELQAKKIRKPDRREFIAVLRPMELTTRLLIHKPKTDGIEVEHYYIASHLRNPIRDELKEVRVFPYFSFKSNTHALWIVNVTIDNPWYESLQVMLNKQPSFFVENAIRVISDKPNSRYRIRFKPMPGSVPLLSKTTEELLGEALGPEHFITSAEHAVYASLVDGVELS